MGRESLLTILLLLLGGMAVQPLAAIRYRKCYDEDPQAAERRAWRRLWLPVVPTWLVGAWLCGWALREPDPVHDRVGAILLVAICLPFALIAVRATFRSVWALICEPTGYPVCTAGFLHPRIVFSPFLVPALDEKQLRAAWEHELAHVRHRDPLRIWLGQLAADLQWPWPGARERFTYWLEVLEQARDDEARQCGISGTDLASAVLIVLRQSSSTSWKEDDGRMNVMIDATLGGDPRALERRIARLLSPRLNTDGTLATSRSYSLWLSLTLISVLMATVGLGAIYGESILHPLLTWTWAI